jgi:hypothetical protein
LRCCDESTKSIIKAAQPTYSINPTMGSWVTTCGMDDDPLSAVRHVSRWKTAHDQLQAAVASLNIASMQ